VSDKLYFAWDSIRLVLPKHANGSMCLADSMTGTEVVQQCRKWRAGGVLGSMGGRGVV